MVLLIFARSATTTAAGPPTAIVANANVAPPASASVVAPEPSAAPLPVAIPTKQVLLAVQPVDAKVTRDGVDLGGAPIALALKPGETATIVLSRPGYKEQTLTLDGSDPKVLVKLVPASSPRGPRRPSQPSQPSSPSTGIGDFQDPFLNKK